MSDETTHRVVGKRHRAPDGSTVEPGDHYAPSDAELAAFPQRFEPLDDSGPADAAAADAALKYTAEQIADILGEYVADPDAYADLQALAGEYDGVPGSGISKGELQTALVDAILAEASAGDAV